MVALGRQADQKFRVIFCSYISDRQIEANVSYRRPLPQKNKTQNKNKNPQVSGRNLRGLQRALQNARGFEACELRGEGIPKAPFLCQADPL